MRVNDVLECCTSVCIVVEESALRGSWVRMIRLQVGMSLPVGGRLAIAQNWLLNSSSSCSGVGLAILSRRSVQLRW